MKKRRSTRGAALDGTTLKRINTELRRFIEHTLNADSLHAQPFWEQWTSISLPSASVRCWEVKHCDRKDCPAHGNEDQRCWLRAGTLCGGAPQGDFARKYKSCFQCEVLGAVEEDGLRSLYEHINILIHHLRQRDEKIVTAAITDPLTGAYNRAYFTEYIDRRLAEAGRHSETMSFIMIDLDGFKGLNDTHGHHAGDRVLAETAGLLHSVIRKSDLLFRYGGDEFLIVLPHADCAWVETIKARIVEAVGQWNGRSRQYDRFRLSLSIGCSTWKAGDGLVQKIREADAQMYEEKKRKNRRRA